MKTKKSANSGIDALTGFEFQRNCALYLLLDDYDCFKNREFFLCIEHHDDFLFCFRTNCLNYIEEVQAYQAKKLSGKIWIIDSRFSEIISKMLEVGNDLRKDSISKSKNYNHKLTFISNTETELSYQPNKDEKKIGKAEITLRVNEQNCICRYNSVPTEIRVKIDSKIEKHCKDNSVEYHKSELDNLFMQWVDFPKTAKSQKVHLIGLMKKNFPHVIDPVAAIELLLNLFREVEAVYNQKQTISLLDTSKRIEGNEVKRAIDIIETEQKTFELWREYSTQLVQTFKVPIGIQKNHENYIKNTFELIKDMSNHEHQLIKDFVKNNNYSMLYYEYHKMFKAYMSELKSQRNINLNDVDLFFTCLCSYVEFHG